MKRRRTTEIPLEPKAYRHNGNGNGIYRAFNVLDDSELTPLTIRQQLFVSEYLKDLNATQAAIRAGYAIDNAGITACQNLRKPSIRSAIVKAMSERANQVGIDSEWVLIRIKFLVERCLQMEPVLDADGRVVEFRFDAQGATRALELLGRHLKLFPTHVKLDGKIQTEEVGPAAQAFSQLVSNLSDDKLFELRNSIKRIAEGANGECRC